jgi:hypothetical protein
MTPPTTEVCADNLTSSNNKGSFTELLRVQAAAFTAFKVNTGCTVLKAGGKVHKIF